MLNPSQAVRLGKVKPAGGRREGARYPRPVPVQGAGSGARRLEAVDAEEPLRVLEALRHALSGEGPAIAPLARGEGPAGLGPLPERVPGEVSVVVTTSGSTGTPKRVALSAAALLASARSAQPVLGGPGRWLLALPAQLVSGLQVLVRSLVAGTEPVVLAGPRFDAQAFLGAAEAAAGMAAGAPRPYTSLVPVQLADLVRVGEADPRAAAVLRRFGAFLIGGQRLEPPLRERAESLGLRVVQSYGSTETGGGCVYDGRPLHGVQARIAGGEILLAGPTLALGYLGEEERTAAAFVHEQGRRWYRTGDAGALAADGRLMVTGRLDNVLVSGGTNVSLDAVESLVHEHPGFAQAVVVAAPHTRWGQAPVVAVERGALTAAGILEGAAELPALRSRVAGRLGRAAQPDRILVLERLPRLPGDKPDRAMLATLASAPGPEEHDPAGE